MTEKQGTAVEEAPVGDVMRDIISSAVLCDSTVSGWLWYCDEHDTHGNADSRGEALALADAHRDYHADGEVEGEAACDGALFVRPWETQALTEDRMSIVGPPTAERVG